MNTRANIYSVRSAKNYRKFAKTFSRFLNRIYPEIRWLKEIKPKHIEVFIILRSPQWTKRTNIFYQDFFKKMQVILNRVYHFNLDLSKIDFIKSNKGKVKDRAISTDDFIQIAQAFFFTKSKLKLAPLLTATIGARTEELISIKPEEIDLKNNVVHLTNCKNGRNRDVSIDKRFLFLWQFVKEYSTSHNWETIFAGRKMDTYIQMFRQIKRKLNLSYNYKESNHGIRKMYAIRRFTEEQLKGFSTDESWSHVQIELGHGCENRKDLFRVYIGENYKEFLNETKDKPKFILDKETYKKQVDFITSFQSILNGFEVF